MVANRVPLSLLPHRLASLLGDQAPGYRACYGKVLDGKMPSAELVNGRWTVAETALPEIAAAFAPAPVHAGGPTWELPNKGGPIIPKLRRRRASAPAAIAA